VHPPEQDRSPFERLTELSDTATLPNDGLSSRLDDLFRLRAVVDGRILELLAEVGRRESFREDGATSTEAWTAERFSVSTPTARTYAHLAERSEDLPRLAGALHRGEITLDQLRAVADMATPETDADFYAAARTCTVRQLAELARSKVATARAAAGTDVDKPGWLRFSDTFRTVTAQLPPEAYAEVRQCLESRARQRPADTDGEEPWDHRLCEAFLNLIRHAGGTRRQGTPAFVVAHVPLETLKNETSNLVGELERDGFLSASVVRRLACDATVAVAVDDDQGRTMYEGRARRWPNDAQRREIIRRDRHCRFPGCTNVTFTDVHHITPWHVGGATDIDNLVLLCDHHHRRVHGRGWSLQGDPNDVLTFVGPSERAMESRPSPLWTAVTKELSPDSG
jgi:hypothetical protein